MFSTGFAFLKNAAAAGPGYDPATTAFLDATGITDPTISDAVNTLVVDLKAASLWDKFYAIWPIVGGTNTTTKYNLINPVDSDAAFRLTFYGDWVFSSAGIRGNASNTYSDTHFVPATDFTSYYNISVGFYATDTHAEMAGYVNVPMATMNNAAAGQSVFQFDVDLGAGTGIGVYDPYSEGNRILLNPYVDPEGLTWINNSGSGGTARIYKNATSVGSTTIGQIDPLITYSFYFGGRNTGGTVNYPTGNEFSFGFISDEIGTANATAFYTIVQAFQTTLGRQV